MSDKTERTKEEILIAYGYEDFVGCNPPAKILEAMEEYRQSSPVNPSSPTVKEGTEPIAMKAGDLRVMVNGEPVAVDFRIISEELYQKLTRKPLDR